ncbi:hypothetical protein FIU95_11725 [Microbulbifer sp. THAF38]|nr:hypothetical protein FIU95_11725 [Microbulbifer sp. THAF38]
MHSSGTRYANRLIFLDLMILFMLTPDQKIIAI